MLNRILALDEAALRGHLRDASRVDWQQPRANDGVRLVTLDTHCPLTTGTWLIGNAYSHDGMSTQATLCDDRGTCSKRYEDVFKDAASMTAIWIPDLQNVPGRQTLSIHSGDQVFRYPDIELPRPIHLTSV